MAWRACQSNTALHTGFVLFIHFSVLSLTVWGSRGRYTFEPSVPPWTTTCLRFCSPRENQLHDSAVVCCYLLVWNVLQVKTSVTGGWTRLLRRANCFPHLHSHFHEFQNPPTRDTAITTTLGRLSCKLLRIGRVCRQCWNYGSKNRRILFIYVHTQRPLVIYCGRLLLSHAHSVDNATTFFTSTFRRENQ